MAVLNRAAQFHISFLAALGLPCGVWTFSNCDARSFSLWLAELSLWSVTLEDGLSRCSWLAYLGDAPT